MCSSKFNKLFMLKGTLMGTINRNRMLKHVVKLRVVKPYGALIRVKRRNRGSVIMCYGNY